MTTAAEHLAQYGVGMEAANAFVMGNLDNLPGILLVARAFGITTSMLGEIAAWPGTPFPAEVVQAFCGMQGYDASTLDRPAGQTGVLMVSDGSAAEGADVVFHVTLSETTTIETSMDAIFSGGTATGTADYGTATATNGVSFNGSGGLSIPVGVSSFDIHVPTVQDTSVEGNETFSLFIGAFAAQGEIVDDDEGSGGPAVTLVGEPTVTEGSDLVYLVNLSATTTTAINLDFQVAAGTASAADFGAATFSDGVSLQAPGLLSVPEGLGSFVVRVPTVSDGMAEPFETVIVTVGGVSGTGYIADA